MFPSSLQKNIRELDRQISLLETECDNMEAENRDASGKMNSKMHIREMPSRSFVPDSCPSQAVHAPKRFTLPPVTPRVHLSNCTHNRAMHNESKCLEDSQNPLNKSLLKRSDKNESTREGCSEDSPRGNAPYEVKQANLGEKKETTNASFEGRKPQKELGESLKAMESSDDSYPIRVEINTIKQKNVSTETSKEQQSWCDLLKEKVLADNGQNRRSSKKTADGRESFLGRNPVDPKFSSDEEVGRNIRLATAESNILSEKWAREFERPMISQSKISTKRRSRSARTRKKSDEVPMDVGITKAIHEKEIQCILWNEDREKSEFLQDLNESIRTLHLLMEDLKTKSTREKRNEVLNDMQNILMKLKSINTLQNSFGTFSSLKGTDVRSIEGENFVDQKRALLAVKKFCRELSDEKSALTDELNTKNYKITNLKNKEKEYLSLISNLKFNLESLREETEEGRLAKRDLVLVKGKLREEAKVIEVLKKSHGKMQALIEHYVLENDKLRTEVKMAKLESQKFQVLLAGKEVEITKYKQELELFQRQISQQLSLLRSKATEKEVEHTMEVISAQANIIQTEVDSLPSETTFEKEEPSLVFDLTETTSSVRTQAEPRNIEEAPSKDLGSVPNREQEGGEESTKLSSSSRELKDIDVNLKDGGFTSCKSDDSLAAGRVCDKKYCLDLRGVLSSSKNLRSSVNEMLQDMRRGSLEKFWPSPPNSRNSSQCSIVSNYSENVSECSQGD